MLENKLYQLTDLKYLTVNKPCNGIKKKKAAIPINDDTPISLHNKYVTIIVCKGPIHK